MRVFISTTQNVDELAARAEKAGIAKHGSPLVTQLYHPTAAGRIGQIADEVGAPWLPRGGRWDAIVSRNKLRYRDFKGELALPVPRLPGRHQAMNAAAMRVRCWTMCHAWMRRASS